MIHGLAWFKSSYSDDEGSNCVEVAIPWQKSSHSDEDGSNCVEISTGPRAIRIRDSKRKCGPQLAVEAPAWAGFIAYIAAA
ncbi:DUF397 domain-containing protein [Streptomyces klenkii]|uniref:DUF397 domain-containing protein n=1 Tax=Streptomyces klenkii TaxID=1420899 RepID=UPI0034055CFB